MRLLSPHFNLALILTLAATWPAAALPTDQADCAFDAMKPQERLQVGDLAMFSMSQDKRNAPPKAAVDAADAALTKAIVGCATQYGWTENDADNAIGYTSIRTMLLVVRGYLVKMGGDANVADLFYAQNKYKILDDSAAGLSSETWANEALVQGGFAPKGSPAFEAVWLYLGFLFQQDDMLTAFAEGKSAQWASGPEKQ
jgi:hypothetical protein